MIDPCAKCHEALIRLEELEKRILQRFELDENRRGELEKLMEVRLDSMNEFRLQLEKERGSYVTIAEMRTWMISLFAVITAVVTVLLYFRK